MLGTKYFLSLLLVFSLNAVALDVEKNNTECLNHLGGAVAEIACYSQISNGIHKANTLLFYKLKKTVSDKDKALLIEYMAHENQGLKFCELARASASNWKFKVDKLISEYHDYEVVTY